MTKELILWLSKRCPLCKCGNRSVLKTTPSNAYFKCPYSQCGHVYRAVTAGADLRKLKGARLEKLYYYGPLSTT
jgi:hypothetical protein